MSHDLETTGRRVLVFLHRAERGLDASLADCAGLVSYLTVASRRAGIAAEAGQVILENAVATVGEIVTARSHLVRTHAALSDLNNRLNIIELEPSFGSFGKPRHRPTFHALSITAQHDLLA